MVQDRRREDSGASSIAAVIPSYEERPAAIEQTIRALLVQTLPFSDIVLVDDCSPMPVVLDTAPDPKVRVLRMPGNQGISGARNAGISSVQTEFVACINVDVLPDRDWLGVCAEYLSAHPEVGIVASRITPSHPGTRLAQWRMMFHERPFPERSGAVSWMAGHAMLIRRAAFQAVGGFDQRLRLLGEDVDFCRRVREAGWEVHFVAETEVHSIQEDSVAVLARVELNRSGWTRDRNRGLLRAGYAPTKRTVLRVGRHLLRGRFGLLLVELRIWWAGLGILRDFYR